MTEALTYLLRETQITLSLESAWGIVDHIIGDLQPGSSARLLQPLVPGQPSFAGRLPAIAGMVARFWKSRSEGAAITVDAARYLRRGLD